MFCPYCQANDTKVIDSRFILESNQIKRRRECICCHERFNTFETAEFFMPSIIKRDGTRESFNVENIRRGMIRALEKRPVSMDVIEAALENIVRMIRQRSEREIQSRVVGELVMDALHRLDEVAYVRFASVYKRFQDISEFKQAIDEIKK